MTELEALRLVREMAHAFSAEQVLAVLTRKGVSAVNIEDAAAQQVAALDLVDALILRFEESEAAPWKALRLAETMMREHGEVVLATASAEQVRAALIDNGLEEFAATLSDAALGWRLEAVRGKWDLPMGFGDWRSELEWQAKPAKVPTAKPVELLAEVARWIAEANGHAWPD